MAGLLNTVAGANPTGDGTSSQPADGAGVSANNFNGEMDEGQPNVTPEEQAQYEEFVHNAMELIYTPEGKVLPDVLKRLATGKAIDALAQTSVWVVTMVESSAKSSNHPVDQDVVFHAGREVLQQLADVQEAASGNKLSDKELQGAWYMALDQYREAATQAGTFDPKEATDAFLSLNEADKEGRADDILPGFDQLGHKMQMEQAQKGGDEESGETAPDAETGPGERKA